jgi:plastocyanin
MHNNLIAIVAISFATVGALWGIGNLLNPEPDVYVAVGVPTKLVVQNDDAVTHDLRVDASSNGGITPINTAPLRGGQDFLTAIVASKPGTYEYYCSYHPQMRGRIIGQ